MVTHSGDSRIRVYAEAVRGVNSRYPFDFRSIERQLSEALPHWVYRYVSAAAGDGRTRQGMADLPTIDDNVVAIAERHRRRCCAQTGSEMTMQPRGLPGRLYSATAMSSSCLNTAAAVGAAAVGAAIARRATAGTRTRSTQRPRRTGPSCRVCSGSTATTAPRSASSPNLRAFFPRVSTAPSAWPRQRFVTVEFAWTGHGVMTFLGRDVVARSSDRGGMSGRRGRRPA